MAKKIDTAGMWTIKGNPITHDGVVMYSGKAIDANGSLGLDPQKLYPVYRPLEELRKACESFNGKPLINNHEMIGTAEDLTRPDEKNIGGTIFNVRPSADQEGYIIADMTIFSEEIQHLVEDGKCELSLGYWCKYRPEVGTHNGVRYEFVQYDLEGNHIALVDCGRMGSGVRVFDHKEKTLVFDSMEMPKMKKKPEKTMDADELRKEIAGLLKDASDEALAKCKDLLAPSKGKDEDEDKGKTGDDDDPDKGKGKDADEPDKGKDADEDKDKSKDEDEPEKKGEDEDEDKDKSKDADEPEKGKGQDSAPTMKQMLAEFSKREGLYKAVEPLTGSFDHDEMTAKEVAKYAAEKLGIATVDGAEVEIVEAHIAGRSQANKNFRAAQDASASVEEGPSASLRKFLGE